MLKKISLSFFALVLVFVFIIPLLLPASFDTRSTIIIEAPDEVIFNRVLNLKTWNDWSPWAEEDPYMSREYSGFPGVVGHEVYWEGEIAGTGRQTLKSLEKFKSIDFNLVFEKPTSSSSQSYWRLESLGDGKTKVTWGTKGSLSYPFERYFGFFLPKMLTKSFDRGLENLKKILETH